jgi:hypothetical protein
MPYNLRPAVEADLPGVGRTIAAAYKNDLLTRTLWPEHLRWYREDDPDHYVDEETPARIKAFAKALRKPGMVNMVVENDAASEPADPTIRRIVGVAQWVSPEIGMDGSVRYEKEKTPVTTAEEAPPRSFEATKMGELMSTLFAPQEDVFGKDNLRRMWCKPN